MTGLDYGIMPSCPANARNSEVPGRGRDNPTMSSRRHLHSLNHPGERRKSYHGNRLTANAVPRDASTMPAARDRIIRHRPRECPDSALTFSVALPPWTVVAIDVTRTATLYSRLNRKARSSLRSATVSLRWRRQGDPGDLFAITASELIASAVPAAHTGPEPSARKSR